MGLVEWGSGFGFLGLLNAAALFGARALGPQSAPRNPHSEPPSKPHTHPNPPTHHPATHRPQVGEAALRDYLDQWDRKYWATYKVLDILQKVFYRSNPAREAFVEMCESDYVQKMTFDSYLYKTVVPGNPLDDVKLLVQTVGSLLRGNALRSGAGLSVSFGSKADAERVAVN